MDQPSLLDYVCVRPFNWIIGIVALVGLVTLIVVLKSTADAEAVQFGLIALFMIGISAFVYKSEVKRQEEEIKREQSTAHLTKCRPEKLLPDNEAALMRGLKAALRQPGPADEVIRRLRQ